MRVIIPENPSELIQLAKDVLAKHALDGAGSPLGALDMADLQAQTTTADTHHALAANLSRDAETATEARDLALGSGETFIPGSVMFYITSIRDFLLGRFRGKEHRLGDWEFEVNKASDESITVVIPDNILELILLAKGILAKHAADGAGSPLIIFDMADMQTKITAAETQNALAKTLEKQAEKANETRDLALGHGKKQTSTTPTNTVLFYLSSARDILLGIYRGREHQLGDWGFEVQDTSAPTPLQLLLTLSTNQIPLSHLSMGIKGTPSQADNCSINWGDATTDALTLSGIYQNRAHDYLIEGIYAIEQKSSKPENITGLIGSGGPFNAYANIQLSPLLVNLEELNFSGSQFTTISIPTELSQLKIVFLVAGNLDAPSVNNLLITINGFNTFGGTINISGGTNASPSGQGIAAKNQLLSRGWTVTTN